MQKFHALLNQLDAYLGSHNWFLFLLLGTGLLYTFYLGFPQIRYFRHSIRVVRGKYDRKSSKGDTSHFQSLTTALSGTVGTGNIAGVALAIHLGGPAALFWMLITAFLGMTTKFVEVLLSHKYREFDDKGYVAGGPMYFMKKRLNLTLSNGKVIKTGVVLGVIFAFATILSSFGTGNLPQINSISTSLLASFGIPLWITGAVLAIILGLVIVGGIKRIAKVTERLVPIMAIVYILGALSVLIANSENIIPAVTSIFTEVFSGTAVTGGFLGASLRFAFTKGVGRGLFSNEAGQGSAPIAHAAAKAEEPVSEGMVAILEPFIDTIVICTITGITLLSSGAWQEKFDNKFQTADTIFLEGEYNERKTEDVAILSNFVKTGSGAKLFTGTVEVINGKISGGVTVLHARSVAEEVVFLRNNELINENIKITNGHYNDASVNIRGKSLLHSAKLTTMAFNKGILGNAGQYIVSLGLLLFAFSTAISWSYYGDRAVTFLWGTKAVIPYRIVYIAGFFLASFTDTTIVWAVSAITIVLMAVPNLIGILIRFKEVKESIADYWRKYKTEGIG